MGSVWLFSLICWSTNLKYTGPVLTPKHLQVDDFTCKHTCTHRTLLWPFVLLVCGIDLACQMEILAVTDECRDECERNGGVSGGMPNAAANDSHSFRKLYPSELKGPLCLLAVHVCVIGFSPWHLLRLPILSGVDGDDLTSSTSDQQDTLQPFCKNFQELHIWAAS